MKRAPLRRKKRIRAKSRKNINYVSKLDKLCGDAVKERDQWTCQRCGKKHGEWDAETESYTVIQWSHVISRRYHCIRWEGDNSKALCMRCHCWWGHNPGQAHYWFSKNWPMRWERINSILESGVKVNPKELYENWSGI